VAAIRDLEQGRRLRPREHSLARLAVALDLDASHADELAQAARHAAAGSGQKTRVRARAGLRLQVLGPLVARREGRLIGLGPPRQRAVLGLLALLPDRLVHRETIIDALWGERPPASAVNLVQTYVSRLRRALDEGRSPRDPEGLLVSMGASYRLQVGPDQLDLLRFRGLAGAARITRSAGDAKAACQLYEEALGLWRDEPLADVDVLRDHHAMTELAEQRAVAVLEYAEAASGAGLHDRVLAHLRALAVRDPLNERVHAWLVIALAASGHRAAALQAYENIRAQLDSQLGIRPGPGLAGAHVRVLRQDVPAAARATDFTDLP
jgi:DNA-binding SARP family transcriptional activator